VERDISEERVRREKAQQTSALIMRKRPSGIAGKGAST
jgi:hypothetical protein